MFNWLYTIFGFILTYIDKGVYLVFGIHNTGICIILFTLVVYLLMYPLNAKQQKSTRLMNKIQPEMKEIQKKYKGKKDQASQLKMNEETQALYAKYGISPFGGCLPMLVTLPIMLCLYRVIYSMKEYVPVLGTAEASRFMNTKVIQSGTDNNQDDNPMGQSMKMMNYFMPVMSGFFCLSLNIGIGLYWIMGSLFRIFQAIFINRKIDKIDMDTLVEQNKEKAAKKSEKLKERNKQMEEYARTRTSSIKSASSYNNQDSSKGSDHSGRTTSNKKYKEGSIASIAHMSTDKKKD